MDHKESDQSHAQATVDVKDIHLNVQEIASNISAAEHVGGPPSRKSSSSSSKSSSSKKSDHAAGDA